MQGTSWVGMRIEASVNPPPSRCSTRSQWPGVSWVVDSVAHSLQSSGAEGIEFHSVLRLLKASEHDVSLSFRMSTLPD